MPCPQTLSLVRSAASQAQRVVSVCSGAYILAAAGLLDGRRHHALGAGGGFSAPLSARARATGSYFCAGWADMDLSRDQQASTWRGHGLRKIWVKKPPNRPHSDWWFHRRGGQTQFSALLELGGRSDRIGRALANARKHLATPLSVKERRARHA